MASTIKNICKGIIIVVAMVFCSCTKYEYIDGGVAKGVHDCSMWDYFHTDGYDWDSTRVMIEYAGMKSFFDGTGEYKQITFFGITNHVICRYLLEKGYARVSDIDVADCKKLLEALIVPKRIMTEDIPAGSRLVIGQKIKEEGGAVCESVRGELFLWKLQDPYQGMEHAGAFHLYIAIENNEKAQPEVVASSNIQTNNGVVQSLNYDFDVSNFLMNR